MSVDSTGWWWGVAGVIAAALALRALQAEHGISASTVVLGLFGIVVLWRLHNGHERGATTVASAEPADPPRPAGRQLDQGLYTIRAHGSAALHVAAMRLPPHISRRPAVARTLRVLMERHHRRSSGALTRLLACLEDFFTRYERALLLQGECDGPYAARGAGGPGAALVARTLPVLMDTRAEALGALQALGMVRPTAVSGDVRAADRAIRKETLECAMRLANTHRWSSPEVDAVANACVTGPRAWDPSRSDARLNPT